MRTHWGLVGRAEELELLKAALSGGRVRGVVLSGAPGVGKTRLAAELVDHATAHGWASAWAVGTRSMAVVPFGALAHLLPPLDGPVTNSLDVLRRAVGELRRRGSPGPLVLGVDDAHLLDDASAGLAHQLALTNTAFVVATVRRGEPVPDAIRSLWKDGLAERLELQPLSRAEVGALLAAVLGGQVHTATQHRLWQVSRGNVLFLRELVLIGLDRGRLAQRGGVWTWSGELAGGDRLAELVAERLAGLSREERAAVEVLAVGEPLPTALFTTVVGRRVVGSLEDRELLSVLQDGRRSSVWLAHPLYGETLRAGVGWLRRRAICRQLADTLGATGGRRRDDVLRLALWRLDGGGRADPAALLAGARRAGAVFDYALAERMAHAALEAGAGREAGIPLADALFGQGRHDQARELLEEHRADATEPELLTEWALVAGANFFWGLGDADRAERTLRDAERELPPGSLRDELTAQRATVVLLNGRAAEALAAVEPVLGRPDQNDEARVRLGTAAVGALAGLGRGAQAIALAEQTLAAAGTVFAERPLLVGELLVGQAIACWQAGRYRHMEQLATVAYDQVAAEKAHDLRGLWAVVAGRAALARGLVRTARSRLREAAAAFAEGDLTGMRPWALACWARAAATLGDADEARAALAECEQRRLPAVRIFDAEILLARAWVAVVGGEHSTGRRLARRAADHAAAAGQPAMELEALHEAVRVGEVGLAERISRVARSAEHALGPTFTEHAVALSTMDGAGLDRSAACFAELDAPLLAAEAAAEAADAHERAGRRGAGLAARERCRRWAAGCEGAVTPALRRAGQPSTLDWLTAREREVAELAARGLSDRKIAERLVLSLRTVGNHLNHVYAKLGIGGRAELAGVLDTVRHRPPTGGS